MLIQIDIPEHVKLKMDAEAREGGVTTEKWIAYLLTAAVADNIGDLVELAMDAALAGTPQA